MPSDWVKNLIRELEGWSEKYPKLQIVISSRPDSGIEYCSYFEVVKLLQYNYTDQVGLIKKLIDDIESQDQILIALKQSTSEIKDLLKTPLLVTLFVMTYRANQVIPESMSDFYSQIFSVVMYRHDKTKPGFIRELRCSLNEKELKEVFETLCFLSKKEDKISFKDDELFSLVSLSLKKAGYKNESPRNIISDIVKSICLIVEDGGEYSFIHKSIQEFFVASFIKSLPDKISMSIYEKISKPNVSFKVELKFLHDIDKYRFFSYYLIPNIENLFDNLGSNFSEFLRYFKENIKLDFAANKNRKNSYKVYCEVILKTDNNFIYEFATNIFPLIQSSFLSEEDNILKQLCRFENYEYLPHDQFSMIGFSISNSNNLEILGMRDSAIILIGKSLNDFQTKNFDRSLKKLYKDTLENLNNAKAYVSRKNDSSILEDF